MGAQALKVKKTFSKSGFFRQTIQSDMLEGIVRIPNSLKHRMLEMILLPIETETVTSQDNDSPLSRFAGSWVGDPLVREDQGIFEVREEFK